MNDLIQYAFDLDGPDAGQELTQTEIAAILRDDTLGWAHLPADHPETRGWIERNLSYLDPHAVTALLADETRPRATVLGDGVLLILRGVNMNPGADPEDMVSVRIWADAHRIITMSRRHVFALDDIAERLRAGNGPTTTGDFLTLLAERLNIRIESFFGELDQLADQLEEEVITSPDATLRHRVVDTRLRAITLRRYVSPQRDALGGLHYSELPFLNADDRRRLQEAHEKLTRLVEDLDAMRERMAIVREELAGQLSERLNRNMYLLSILSAVFLPLGFLTGLFGINIAGMPGADTPGAFWIFIAALIGVVGLQVVILRLLKWV